LYLEKDFADLRLFYFYWVGVDRVYCQHERQLKENVAHLAKARAIILAGLLIYDSMPAFTKKAGTHPCTLKKSLRKMGNYISVRPQ